MNPKTIKTALELLAKSKAEIKRLEAVHEHDQKLIDGATSLGIALGDKIVKLEARIALLESALGLPEGCDVFQVEPAKADGALDQHRDKWVYIRTNKKGEHIFRCCGQNKRFDGRGVEISKDPEDQYLLRLYCIKKGSA